MKVLTSVLLIGLTGSLNAASTTTIPVEHKVVELNITYKEPVKAVDQKTGKRTRWIKAGTCSGSFITPYGDILTARHCVEKAERIEVTMYDQREYKARVVAISPVHDLAMIHIDKLNTPYFRLAKSVERGETIFVLGSPLGLSNILTTGVVAHLAGDALYLDCSVLPGNSGSAVFNQKGELVGVANAVFIVMLGTTHLSVAQGLDAVLFFLLSVFGR